MATAVEGWGWTATSRKCHYFRGGTSLCGKYGFRSPQAQHDTDNGNPGPEDCKACRAALDKERAAHGVPQGRAYP